MPRFTVLRPGSSICKDREREEGRVYSVKEDRRLKKKRERKKEMKRMREESN